MTRPKPRYTPGDKIAGRYHVHDVKMGGMGELYLCLDLETIPPNSWLKVMAETQAKK
ncbi:hypothetical protein QUF64_16435 [Anaerolineales bacterium HSG6]|nr:hypothetical protein [Anaerolineales bacterium HSG6]